MPSLTTLFTSIATIMSSLLPSSSPDQIYAHTPIGRAMQAQNIDQTELLFHKFMTVDLRAQDPTLVHFATMTEAFRQFRLEQKQLDDPTSVPGGAFSLLQMRLNHHTNMLRRRDGGSAVGEPESQDDLLYAQDCEMFGTLEDNMAAMIEIIERDNLREWIKKKESGDVGDKNGDPELAHYLLPFSRTAQQIEDRDSYRHFLEKNAAYSGVSLL